MGTPVSALVWVVPVLSRASTSAVQPTTLKAELYSRMSAWPAAARFCTNVLYVPMFEDVALCVVDERKMSRNSPALRPAGLRLQFVGTVFTVSGAGARVTVTV